MHLALYRKYRATSLGQVIGQPQVTTPLHNALEKQQFSHAYLFIGPRGTGKTSVARILAHAVNDFPYELEDQHLDIIEIDAASNTGVDNIRELREKALVAPSQGKYKVYIIDEVHMLSKSAFNALLKTLEEPPAHVIFIMATTDAHKVPITITSRSQCYQFQLADQTTLEKHLQTIATAEQIDIAPAAINLIAERGRGSFRDAISLLDQIITLPDRPITAEAVIAALGLPSDQKISALLSAYGVGDIGVVSQSLSELISSGLRPEAIAEELINKIIKSPTASALPLLNDLIEVARSPFPPAKLLLALTLPLVHGTNSAPALHSTSTSASVTATSSPAPASTESNSTPSVPATSSAIAAAKARLMHTLKNPAITSSAPANTSTPVGSTPTPVPENTFIQPTIQAPVTASSFDWETFLSNVKFSSSIISSQLARTTYRIDSDTLYITPSTKVAKNILETPKNREIITKYLGELNLVIENPSGINSAPSPSTSSAAPPSSPSASNDVITPASNTPSVAPSPFADISAIMGAVKEVNLNNDDIPV